MMREGLQTGGIDGKRDFTVTHGKGRFCVEVLMRGIVATH
jgi:hypothetical protein